MFSFLLLNREIKHFNRVTGVKQGNTVSVWQCVVTDRRFAYDQPHNLSNLLFSSLSPKMCNIKRVNSYLGQRQCFFSHIKLHEVIFEYDVLTSSVTTGLKN